MALTAPNDAGRRIVAALGLERCRSMTLRMSLNDFVTVTAEQYADERSLDALATELETNEYALVPKEQAGELERLRSLTRFQDRVIRSGDTATLTSDEREALAVAAAYVGSAHGVAHHEKVLLGLLERLA